jgi:hypothetical protein
MPAGDMVRKRGTPLGENAVFIGKTGFYLIYPVKVFDYMFRGFNKLSRFCCPLVPIRKHLRD